MEEDKKWWSKVKFVFVAAAMHKRIKLFTGFSSESSDGSKNDLAKFSHSSLLQIPLLHSHLSASSFVFSDDETSLIHFRCKKPSRSGVGRVRPKKNKRKKNRNNDKAVCNVEELYEQRVPSVFTAFCFNFLTTPKKALSRDVKATNVDGVWGGGRLWKVSNERNANNCHKMLLFLSQFLILVRCFFMTWSYFRSPNNKIESRRGKKNKNNI